MKHNVKTKYQPIDVSGAPLDIEKRLLTATSGEEIRSLLSFGNECKPSGTLRRRWLRASAQAYTRIREGRAEQTREERLQSHFQASETSTEAAPPVSEARAAIFSAKEEKTGGEIL